ncbi:MAG: transcriptional repressor, CopY family, partial [uncultured Gemmatimonadaceae bacterium]
GHPPPARRGHRGRDHGRPPRPAHLLRRAVGTPHPRREAADPLQGGRAALRVLRGAVHRDRAREGAGARGEHLLRGLARAGGHRPAPHVGRRFGRRRGGAAARDDPPVARARRGGPM